MLDRILILAGAVFYYGAGANSGGPASLFDAYDLLRDIVGQGTFLSIVFLGVMLFIQQSICRSSHVVCTGATRFWAEFVNHCDDGRSDRI